MLKGLYMMNAQLVEPYKGRLLEGPIWDVSETCLRFVDIKNNYLYRYTPATQESSKLPFKENVTFVANTDTSSLLVTTRDTIWFVDTKTGEKEIFVQFEDLSETMRFNDGGIDPYGRLWIGTMNEDEETPNAKLYVVDKSGNINVALTGLTISNGLAWNAAGDTMYAIDTPTQKIMAYPFDEQTTTLSNGRVIYDFSNEIGSPDGMTIDATDQLWVALWGGSRVVCIDPETQQIMNAIDVPAANVTSCAFEPGSARLYITTASEGLSEQQRTEQPNAGSLFAADIEVTSAPIYLFQKK